jgi:hypothetical protein
VSQDFSIETWLAIAEHAEKVKMKSNSPTSRLAALPEPVSEADITPDAELTDLYVSAPIYIDARFANTPMVIRCFAKKAINTSASRVRIVVGVNHALRVGPKLIS